MDAINLLRYFVALMFVLALAGVAVLIKRYGTSPAAFKDGLKDKLGKWNFVAPERRLQVVETLMIGPKQRLFIVRRDNVEHLVVSGPDGTTVIEASIPAASVTPMSTASRIAAS
jgi:flagellar protein FliO/FliZ